MLGLGVGLQKSLHVPLVANQAITNGNFALNANNLATGFTVGMATAVSCTGNVQTFIATANLGSFKSGKTFLAGHRYFISADIKAFSALVYLVLQTNTNYWAIITHPGDGAYHNLSGVFDVAAAYNAANTFIQDHSTTGWANISVKNYMLVDMGVDATNPLYKLSAAAMKTLISSYFEGQKDINY